MKTIRTYPNTVEAGLARSILESAGIEAVLADEHSCTLGYGSVVGGVRLQVPDVQADPATKILDEQDGVTPLPDDFIPPGGLAQPPLKRREKAHFRLFSKAESGVCWFSDCWH